MATKQKARKTSGRRDRRKTTSTRITPETRAQLEEAAAQTGRSLAQEIESRLERSFLDQEAVYQAFGGKKSYEFCRVLATMANAGSDDETWTRDIVQWWKTAPIGEFLAKVNRGETIDLDEQPCTPQEEGLRLFAAMMGDLTQAVGRNTAIAEGERILRDGLRRAIRGLQSGDDSDRE